MNPRNFTSQIQTKTIPAGLNQVVEFLCGGERVTVLESSAPFDLQMENWGKLEVAGGYTIKTGNDHFRIVRVYNKSATVALTVTLSIGSGDGTVGILFDYLKQRSVVTCCTNGVLNAGNAGNNLGNASFYRPGISTDHASKYAEFGVPPNLRRRDLIVTNGDPANSCLLALYQPGPAATPAFDLLQPLEKRIITHDKDVLILRNGADVTSVYLEENFYV